MVLWYCVFNIKNNKNNRNRGKKRLRTYIYIYTFFVLVLLYKQRSVKLLAIQIYYFMFWDLHKMKSNNHLINTLNYSHFWKWLKASIQIILSIEKLKNLIRPSPIIIQIWVQSVPKELPIWIVTKVLQTKPSRTTFKIYFRIKI